MMKRTLEKHGDNLALRVKRDDTWHEWTYQQYWDEAKIIAKAFIKLGLQRHHSVCILGFNSPEWFIGQLAAIMAGAFSAGIYTTNNPSACKYIIGNFLLVILFSFLESFRSPCLYIFFRTLPSRHTYC